MVRGVAVFGMTVLLLASSTGNAATSFKILGDQSNMEVTITGRFTDADLVTVEIEGVPVTGSDTQTSGASGGLEVELTWTGDEIATARITDLDISADPEVSFSFDMGGLAMDVDLLGLNVATHPSTPALPTDVTGGAFAFDEDDNIWLGTGVADWTVLSLVTGSTSLVLPFTEALSGDFTEAGGVLTMTFDLNVEFGETIDLAEWGVPQTFLDTYGIVYAVVEAEITGALVAVPEPTTGGIFVLGMSALSAWLRRRQR